MFVYLLKLYLFSFHHCNRLDSSSNLKSVYAIFQLHRLSVIHILYCSYIVNFWRAKTKINNLFRRERVSEKKTEREGENTKQTNILVVERYEMGLHL